MEYDQRVIIRFRYNEQTDAHDIIQKPQEQFAQDAYVLRTVQFWTGEIRRGRQGLHDEIGTG
jgi:hypothetical protein